jgi:putative spermidine/putrescine transport system ATP-binding protein
MSSVELRRLRKTYGDFEVIRHLDLKVKDGEFLTILGASGSGKTTCLRIIAGFISPTAGQVLFDGKDVTKRPAYRRNVGMVFQNYALFPHLSVAKNISFGLEARGVPHLEREARVDEALGLVQLEGLRDRLPHGLSGGERQRVALARAVATRPELLLLDEPLSALDLRLRQELRTGIKKVQRQLGLTTLLVTHDQGEALSLSDRVAVISKGEMLQIDTPALVYQRPSNRAVADFIGKINLLECQIAAVYADGTYLIKLREEDSNPVEVPTRSEHQFKLGDRCLFGIRPEEVSVGTGSQSGLTMQVVSTDYFGDTWSVECTTRSGSPFFLVIPSRAQVPEPASEIRVSWSPDCGLLLPA